MSGASGSGEEVETGRTNRAEGRTILWAQVPPGQSNFNGPAIFIAEVAKDAEDPDDYEDGDSFIPSNSFDGIVGKGWSGGSASNFGGTPGGTGVVGRGGRNQGTGVFGLGGGTPEPGNGGAGGIGVHGLGGPQADFFADYTTPPGAGLVGQGGRQSEFDNRLRLPHAAGVIGLGGLGYIGARVAVLSGAEVYGAEINAETRRRRRLWPGGRTHPDHGSAAG